MTFYKGQIPWNKGLVKRDSPLIKGGRKSGGVAWNKGMKGYLSSDRHYNWKGGITKIDRLCRLIDEYKEWRSDVFKRDKWTCKTCGRNDCYVTAHHIKGFSKILKENNIKTVSDARKCSELWDRNNGVTLCEDCHKLTDNYKGRAVNPQ